MNHSMIDWKTFWLLASVIALQCLAIFFCVSPMGYVIALLLATLAMNLTFTLWHEATHGNFSRLPIANHFLGILGSILSVYPGYYARRREHLAHHRFEGDKELDPVFPRIQGNLLSLPKGIFLSLGKNPIPQNFLPLQNWQKIVDLTSVLLATIAMLALIWNGHLLLALSCWILPRFFILLLHAWYICYLPHAVRGGGFEKYRIVTENPVVFFLTLGQNLHGIHHKFPTIPWHQYRSHAKRGSNGHF